jgi:hypothetical protein
MTFIYALRCPETGDVMYIGKADNPVRRLKSHLSDARRGSTKHATARWIVGLLMRGSRPRLDVLCEVPPGETWQEAEKRHIAQYRAAGAPLTNSTSGGQGLNLLREVDRQAVSASLSAAWNRPGARERRRTAILAGNACPEARQRRIAAASDPATKARRTAALRAGLFQDAEAMARRRASQTAAANRPDVKAAKADASKARWADPAFRAAVIEKQKAAWIKRKERT